MILREAPVFDTGSSTAIASAITATTPPFNLSHTRYVYKKLHLPKFSLILHKYHIFSITSPALREIRSRNVARETEKEEIKEMIPFSSLVGTKQMVIDQYLVGTFFVSLFSFVIFYILRRDNANSGKPCRDYPLNCAMSSMDGTCSSADGSDGDDVIIVGAGVAGSALAHTLGKVHY